jgi:hypothetical protein
MTYQKIQLTIGHNVQGVPTWQTSDVARAAAGVLEVDGMTAVPCYGLWRGEAEESTRIEIVTEPARVESIVARVPALCRALRQDAIMCETAAGIEFVPGAVQVGEAA